MLVWALIVLSFLPGTAFAASPLHVEDLTPPRTFGIVMGDILEQKFSVRLSSGYQLDFASLPQVGSSLNDFLEVCGAAWSEEPGKFEVLYHIRLSYQVFKGVRSPETLEVPALPLRAMRGNEMLEGTLPSWQFTLSPIIPPGMADENVALAGDLPLPSIASESDAYLLSFLVVNLLGLGLYAAWCLQWPPFRRRVQPFRKALNTLRLLAKEPATPETSQRALRLVHSALDQTAGYVVFNGQFERFLVEYPQYVPLRAELGDFFTLSSRMFFVCDDGYEKSSNDVNVDFSCIFQQLDTLCLAMSRIEHTHA